MAITTTLPADRHLRADARRNHDRILAAAEVAFRIDGAAVQMEEIARAAGVGIGTLYRHFPTKEALVAELIAIRMLASVEEAEQALAEQDAWAALERFVYRSAEQIATDAGLRDVIAGTHGLDTDALAKWKTCASARDCLLERMAALLDRARADGLLRVDVTDDDFGAFMCGMSAAINRGSDWRLVASIMLQGLRAP